MFKTIKNALKTPEVRKRLLYTLVLIIVFRIGCFITVPGVDMVQLEALRDTNTEGIAGLIDIISGGAFSNFSIFAMSVTPYITASIVIQLLSLILPSLKKLTQEGGEVGRQKINKYTKAISIVLALIEGIGLYFSYQSQGIFVDSGALSAVLVVTGLMAGTALLMWLGDQITDKGIGNGVSMIIFIGIVSRLPSAISSIWNRLIMSDSGFSTTGLLMGLALVLGALILVTAVVFIQQAERRIPVQYAKRVVGRKMMGAQNTYIPLKIAMAGVMPIIFASSFMTFPAMLIQIFIPDIATQTGFWNVIYNLSIATSSSNVAIGYTIANAIIYLLLIVGFTFFYIYATFNPAEVSANIKKNGGFIPGIRAGKPTTEYLSSVLTKLTLFGGLFLALIAILPMFMRFLPEGLNVAFGGTSILIVVGVALETVQQLESQMVMKHYKGFLE